MDKYLSTGSCTTKKATHMLWGGSKLLHSEHGRVSAEPENTGDLCRAPFQRLQGEPDGGAERRGEGTRNLERGTCRLWSGSTCPFSLSSYLAPSILGRVSVGTPPGKVVLQRGWYLQSLGRDLTETGWGRIAGVRCIDPSFRRPRPPPLY